MKKLILILFLSAVLLPLAAQPAVQTQPGGSSKAAADSLIEQVTMTPNPVGRGDLFTMTIIVNHSSSYEVDMLLDDLPEQLTRWRGPYIRSFVAEGPDGQPLRKVRITATFKSKKSGRMIIPGLDVLIDGKTQKTPPQLLRVGLYKSRKLYIPLEVDWLPAFTEIYVGEAVPIYLEVFRQEVVSLFERTRVALPREGFFEKAEGLGEIKVSEYGDIVLYDVPAAAYLFTSPVPGEIKIPAAGVDSDGLTGWTSNLFLQIKPVPQKVKSTGAVGSFEFRTAIESGRFHAGEEFVVSARVEGMGNLHFLKVPEPAAAGCILVSTAEDNDYQLGESGYYGSKTVRWTFSATEAGEASIRLSDFSFLNKESGVVETIPGKSYELSIEDAPSLSEPEPEEVFTLSRLDSAPVHEWKNLYRNPYSYLLLLPGLLFFLLTLILPRHRGSIALVITVIMVVASYSVIRTFVFSGEGLKAEHSASDYYNLSVDAWESGDTVSAIHNVRTALYLEPQSRHYASAVSALESRSGFGADIRPSQPLHPDLFFYIGIVLFNLLFIAAFLRKLWPGGVGTVVLLMFAFTILLSFAMLGYSHLSRRSLTGIISAEDVYLKKIPREAAENWLAAEPGMPIRLLEESGDFYLVETGFGVRGWVSGGVVLKDRPD